MPGLKQVAIGLYQGTGVGTGKAVATFVVKDINEAVQILAAKGVQASKPVNVGQGVLLSFFADPDGNQLGLRQNGPAQPQPGEVGWTA
jgi:lactoylglutathione lyase